MDWLDTYSDPSVKAASVVTNLWIAAFAITSALFALLGWYHNCLCTSASLQPVHAHHCAPLKPSANPCSVWELLEQHAVHSLTDALQQASSTMIVSLSTFRHLQHVVGRPQQLWTHVSTLLRLHSSSGFQACGEHPSYCCVLSCRCCCRFAMAKPTDLVLQNQLQRHAQQQLTQLLQPLQLESWVHSLLAPGVCDHGHRKGYRQDRDLSVLLGRARTGGHSLQVRRASEQQQLAHQHM